MNPVIKGLYCITIFEVHTQTLKYDNILQDLAILNADKTRTTRMPVFWGYPPPPHDYPYYWVILDLKSKEDKVKVRNLKNLPKWQILNFETNFIHMTHLLKLLDKMCKDEMDQTSIFEDTERTRLCPQTDGQGETNIPHFQLCWSRGYKNVLEIINSLTEFEQFIPNTVVSGNL